MGTLRHALKTVLEIFGKLKKSGAVTLASKFDQQPWPCGKSWSDTICYT